MFHEELIKKKLAPKIEKIFKKIKNNVAHDDATHQ